MTYIPTGAGAALHRELRDVRTITKAPGTFIDGPRILVGPFNWKDDGKEHGFSISAARYKSREGSTLRAWIRRQMTKDTYYARGCRAAANSPSQQKFDAMGGPCQKVWRGWTSRYPMPPKIWKGEWPFVRTVHPTTGEDWGIYIKFTASSVSIKWKKIQKSIFAKIWNFIKKVVSFIVETLKDMFAVLAAMACMLAKGKLAQVSTMQQSKTPLTAGEIAAAKRMGLSDKQIADLAKSKKTGVIDSQSATAIGNAIISNVCGVDPPMLPPASSTPWLLWGVVGVVGLVGTAVLLKKGK